MITRKPHLKRRAATADCSIEGRISCDNAATTITAQKAKVVNKVVDNASVGGPQKAGDAALSATLLATEATLPRAIAPVKQAAYL